MTLNTWQRQRLFGTIQSGEMRLSPAAQIAAAFAILQNFKSISTRRINQARRTPGAPVWQQDYDEHIIRSEAAWERIRRYIQANPLRWEEDQDDYEPL